MAAIAVPYPGGSSRRRASWPEEAGAGQRGARLRLVEPFDAGSELGSRPPGRGEAVVPSLRKGTSEGRIAARRLGKRRRIRLLPGLASLGLLAAVWLGAGALSSAHHPAQIVQLEGARLVHGEQLYVVRPGDTLWAIASRLEPGADPRPLVDRLAAELHGAPLEAGETLRLP